MSDFSIKVYVVRNMETGAYLYGSTPGGKTRWIDPNGRKKPRQFKQINHLKMFLKSIREPIRSTWEVIEMHTVVVSKFSAGALNVKALS